MKNDDKGLGKPRSGVFRCVDGNKAEANFGVWFVQLKLPLSFTADSLRIKKQLQQLTVNESS